MSTEAARIPASHVEAAVDSLPAAMTLRQYALMVGIGAFATTFAQSRVLAQLPTTFLLKEQFHLEKEQVAFFFFWVTFAWNLKPLAGVLTDAFPLLGTRRRHYMLLGAIGAGICWLAMGLSEHAYTPLLIATIGMNITTVVASTVMGALMVEAGQAFKASGRMSSLRQFVQNVAGILAPVLGGYLATRAYGWTTGIGAATVLALAACTFTQLHEAPVLRAPRARANVHRELPPVPMMVGVTVIVILATWLARRPELSNVGYSLYALAAVGLLVMALATAPTSNPVIVGAQTQLRAMFKSRPLWLAAAMLLLLYTVPGFNTALVYRQSDVLQFSKPFIGILGSIEGVTGVGAAVFYAVFCRRLSLRALMLGSISLSGLATLLYLVYNATTAPLVHALAGGSLGGFFVIMVELTVFDLSIRATPPGCEALGFALLMSVRNFGIAMSDVIGSQLMDQYHLSFNRLVVINAVTTMAVLVFVPLLPRSIILRREGELATH